MSEIREIPWNGLTVVSTFAGCGGSSTGYRMAGYRVLLANEFVPVAQDSYAANKADYTLIDGRDVKLLKGAEILKRVGLKPGELDVFDGSPPCQAFSTAGQREKGWGKDKHYEHGAAQKNEDLFFDYCRLRDELMPRVFVAENVSGLVKGAAKGYFLEILKRLKVGYRVQAQLLDAQWLGVPQARQRIIFVGVRNDVPGDPVFPVPLQYRYSVRDALPHLSSAVQDFGGKFKPAGEMMDRPCATIVNTSQHIMVQEGARVIHDTGGTGTFAGARDVTDRPCPTITNGKAGNASHHYKVEEITGIGGRGGFGNVQIDSPDMPSATIGTGPSAGNGLNPAGEIWTKDEAGVTKKRRFTIDELKRICGFPDDFVLKGKYAQQWERLGNSVPPVMMMHIAAAIRDGVLLPARAKNSARGSRSPARSTIAKPPKGAARSRRGEARAETT